MTPRFKLYLTQLNSLTEAATALTLEAALAVTKAFEVEHAGDPEAFSEVRELDGSNAGIGTLVHWRWMGGQASPDLEAEAA